MSLTLNEAKEIEVFFIEDETIKTINLYEKMCESIDETTTPRGVAPRLFLETETIEIDPDDFDDEEATLALVRHLVNETAPRILIEDFPRTEK
jgi:hypothetical protein